MWSNMAYKFVPTHKLFEQVSGMNLGLKEDEGMERLPNV